MPSELLGLARSIALEAGALAARRRAEGVEVAATKSSIVDVVTAADREVEDLVRGRIADARPDDAVLGEEGGGTAGTSGLTWVVDPIDGTVNYLYGIPHYAVSIAVVEGDPDPATWTALAGAVHAPPLGELFHAERGGGARLNDGSIVVGPRPPLEQALVATGFAYDAHTRERQGAVVAALLPRVRDIRRQGVASLDLCFVACGRVDAYFERTLNPWDHAAGALIAREAGAIVTGRGDAAAGRDFTLAAAPGLASELAAVLDGLGVTAWDLPA
ncbi:inositol monophosphatase family protein [Pseudolysinimonas kribbensis]|uniref:Inositol-1-monophosphatase n=1 Tax=Pseudolysinimonas kribbensis TaxID=433641 RepID=A0ABQ6K5B8_9MICO|nr:inositol monophosphatase [Pseudolysinimonas kribbensis]